MSHVEVPSPLKARFFSPGTVVLTVLAAAGLSVYAYRLLFGIGAVTNLNDQYPWGIWIGIDVAGGVALAAAGFTTAALVEIFHHDRYHSLLRPALLNAMLGYTFVVIGLLADLGRYYNVWHPMLPSMWQGNSVLFEVGICVMFYLTVLYVEFLPVVVERFGGRVALPGALAALNGLVESLLSLAQRFMRKALWAFIIAGVVLSCLHQSSLGNLMVIAPTKVHALWYTPVLPALFLLSAIAGGFPLVIFESIITTRSFRLAPETPILSSLARFTPVLLGVYLMAKLADLTIRGAWGYVDGSARSLSFLVEVGAGVALPMVLLLVDRVRKSEAGLFVASLLVILGIALNRINVFLVAYQPPFAEAAYVPAIWEVVLTVGLMSLLVLVYRAVVMIFPVVSIPVAAPAAHPVTTPETGDVAQAQGATP